MPVSGIDHFNVTTTEAIIDRCRAFYVDVLGMREGPRPPFRSRGFWLYAGENAIVHLTITDSHRGATSLAPLDHIALACSGLDDVLARLAQHGSAYELDRVPDSGTAQIFLRDPAGVALELNFA